MLEAMETNEVVSRRVREVCADLFGMSVAEVSDTASAVDFPVWDSLHHFTLIASLEDRFGITYTSDEIPTMTSIPAIIQATIGHMHAAHCL